MSMIKMTPPKKRGVRSSAAKLKTLLRQRANILGSAIVIKRFNDQYQESQIHQVQVRIDSLNQLWTDFACVQNEIEEIENRGDGDDDLEFTMSDERVKFQDLYYELKASLTSKLPDRLPAATPTGSRGSGQPFHSVRLPEINIPLFGGNPSEWIAFRDIFKSMIHCSDHLSSVQKMHYLKAALTDEAARIVANLEVNTDNYSIAWKSVCERYDNPNLLLKHHFAALFAIPSVKKPSASTLYDLVDEFDHHVCMLEKLDTAANLWNSVLVETLSKRLDSSTLKEWENNCEGTIRPTYQSLVDFVRKTSRVLQSVKLLQTQSLPYEQKSIKPKPISTHIAAEAVNKCRQCKQAHPLFKCDQFLAMEAKQRFELVKKHGLCINCLKGSHLAKNCSNSGCRYCSKKHHTLLHLPPLNVAARTATQSALACSTVSSEVMPSVQCQLSYMSTQNSQSQTCPSPPPPPIAFRSTVSKSANSSVVGALSPPPVVPSVSRSIGSNLELDSSPVASLVAPQRDLVTSGGEVFLSTVVIKVNNNRGSYHFVRGVLDSCSQANFISESMARRLELKRSKIDLQVSGIGQGIVHIRSKVVIKFSSRFGKFEYLLECLVIPQITVTLPSKHIDISRWNLPKNIPLADPKFNISSGVDLLIGAELFYSLLESDKVQLCDGFPTLQRTALGYVVAGKLLEPATTPSICIVSSTKGLETILQRFWETESIDDGKKMTPTEQACEDHFKDTVSRAEDGRYIVRLPVREELLALLGDSLAVAQRRFFAIERKFRINSDYKREYITFMEEYHDLGHMELSPRVENSQFVLPHHAIHRPESSTTKTRVVFDATCKGSSQLSLNDILLVGPIVQPPLLATVLNFRAPRFVFIADIEKMFRQVWVHPADRKLQQILWRSDTSQPILRYQLKTITYGTSSAPYLATRVLNQLAEDEGNRFPLGAAVVREGFYVDDVLTGDDDLQEVIETIG
ncbi:uncharacterized protein LOC128736443 [Sabethes cyaneus]|uniref:uncharacterized protein LOC128736443 n=1 Tax=Sabethes cyaneus TaxID=53552 RepID=UPI00237E7E78|nr:uncharacterized protein LOC128736443 [Sabethes cyaneus]